MIFKRLPYENVCRVYARAHNGNNTGKITIKVVNYAHPDRFMELENTQADIERLFTDYPEEVKTIAEYYERKYAEHNGHAPISSIALNDARTEIVPATPEVEYKEIYDVLFKVLDSFPGEMMIIISDRYMKFDLSDARHYNVVVYSFVDTGEWEETARHFEIAPRWSFINYGYI